MRADRRAPCRRARSASRRAAPPTAGSASSSCASRIAQASPAGPPPTIATPTSSCSSAGASGAAMTSDAANGGGYAAGAIGIAAIVLRACAGSAQVHSRRCQVALAASATWPRGTSPSTSQRRCRSTCAPTPSPARRPRCARPWRGRRSATTSTARTRPSTRSSAGPPSCAGARRRVFVPSGTMANQIGDRALGRAGRRGLRPRQLAHPDRRGRRHGGALGRASARAAQRGLRPRRRGAARRRADGRERRPPAASRGCSASRTRTRARAGASGAPSRWRA